MPDLSQQIRADLRAGIDSLGLALCQAVTVRPFRFGVNLLTSISRTEWRDKVRRAEDLGYDVVLAPDHLGMPAPFPSLVAAAEVTSRVRLGTLVLNAGFYKPALLARDAATTDQLVDGRLELGVGTGYVREEFDAAELAFPGPAQRAEYLERTIVELRRLLVSAGHRPAPAQRPLMPIMVAGQGNKVLRTAVRYADIIAIPGISTSTPTTSAYVGDAALEDRVDFIRAEAGDRFDQLELSLLVQKVHLAGQAAPDLSTPRLFAPELSDDQLLALPGVLHGSPNAIVDTLHKYRENYGVTYFTVLEKDLATFAPIIERIH